MFAKQLVEQVCIEHIHDGATELAVVLRSSFVRDGIAFLTPNSYSQQLGYMNRPAGYRIRAHIHNSVPRAVTYTREALFIKSGRVRVDFYNDQRRYVESCILEVGDVVLLTAGGHGFEMLERTEMIEIKQGPYTGDQDKTLLADVDAASLRIRA